MNAPPEDWSRSLTRRTRVLLHTGPLHDLRRRFLRGPAAMRHYDVLALAIVKRVAGPGIKTNPSTMSE